MSPREIRDVCRLFDGKRTDVLERAAAELPASPACAKTLVNAAENAASEREAVAATWLLLHLVRQSPDLAATHTKPIIGLLARAESWEVRLHLLQLLNVAETGRSLSAAERRSLFQAAAACRADENKMVRAWSLSVLGRLGAHLPARRDEIASLIGEAERSEAASVRARIRQLRKAGVLDWMMA